MHERGCNDSRGGYSLIEVLLALVVLTVGLLAVASASAAVTRMLSSGALFTQAAIAGDARLEGLRVEGCVGPRGGDSLTGPVTVSWQASGPPDRNDLVTVVRVQRGAVDRIDTLRGVVLCP